MISNGSLPLDATRRFNYLYERTASDLAKLNTFANEPETRRFLESLVARCVASFTRRGKVAPFSAV